MSKPKTKHLGEKYKAVTPLWIDTDNVGLVRPGSLSKLQELYERLPQMADKVNKKVGLTDRGYVVTRNQQTNKFVYWTITVRSDGPSYGKAYGRESTRDPYGDFGDSWIVRP